MRKPPALFLLAGLAVGCAGEVPTVPIDVGPAFQLVTNGSLPFSSAATDCNAGELIDPGTVRVADGLVIIKGQVFTCPQAEGATGDIEGDVQVTWNNAVFKDPFPSGHVSGKVTFTVTSFFGNEDLTGTFEGPFSGSLADLLFGESRSNRTGTGDFRGLTMHSVFYQDPPGSGITFESGTIVGK